MVRAHPRIENKFDNGSTSDLDVIRVVDALTHLKVQDGDAGDRVYMLQYFA